VLTSKLARAKKAKAVPKFRNFAAWSAPVILLSGLLSGCATPPPASDTAGTQAFEEQNDPIEPANRFFYAVNDKIDHYAFKPLAEGYVDITTVGIRNHVGDFVTNFSEPAVFGQLDGRIRRYF
jgi:phospholipid-binding lipoprotein MlaA